MDESKLLSRIEELRSLLVSTCTDGFNQPEILLISQELDMYLNKYYEIKRNIKEQQVM